MNRTHVTGMLGIGVGGIAALTGANLVNRDSTDAETDAGDRERRESAGRRDVECDDHPDLALVFAYDYYPGVPITPLNRVPQETVDAILGSRTTGSKPVVSDLTQYHGYVAQYRREQTAAGEYTLVFVHEQTLRPDVWYRFDTDVTVFDERARLLRSGVRLIEGSGGNTGGEPTAPTEETTYEVIVDAENVTSTVDGES